jgi:uncharacterized protein YcfJ
MNNLSDIKQQTCNLNEGVQNLRNYINEVAQQSAENGTPVEIDEGVLGAIVGGIIGGTAGKSIMNAVCKALGINEKGSLGQLLTSRMVLTAVGAQIGL